MILLKSITYHTLKILLLPWSNRGKLRNEFLPQVEKQFGIETYEKILYLSESLESYKKILDSKIFTPLYDSVINLKSKECLNIGIMVKYKNIWI